MARPRSIARFIMASLISMTLLGVVTLVGTFFFRDTLIRWHYMGKLCSEDPKEQVRGVNYVYRHAQEPEVIAHANRLLDRADDACFEKLVRGLSVAQLWGPNMHGWVRYLAARAGSAQPGQRSGIAVELGKTLWQRKSGYDDPRLAVAVEKLLGDADANVRLNALSAAAVLPEPRRSELLKRAAGDAVGAIAEHARIMLALIAGTAPTPPEEGKPELTPELKRLAELEAMGTNSADVAVTADMPPMVRLQAVRVSRGAVPGDLKYVLGADQPVLRDLACVIAIERFGPEACRALAADLLRDFAPSDRMGGAILAGLAGRSDELVTLLRKRLGDSDDWIMQQHYLLGLDMMGERTEGFDPARLLLNEKMPRTTVTLGLLAVGRLEGVDWLLNPWGSPPLPLTVVLGNARYWYVVRHFLAGVPGVEFWGAAGRQKFDCDVIRDWYLLRRPEMDREERPFGAAAK